jgi:hypothetical protein
MMELPDFTNEPQPSRAGVFDLVFVAGSVGLGGSIGSKAFDDVDDVDIAEFRYLYEFADRRVVRPSGHS